MLHVAGEDISYRSSNGEDERFPYRLSKDVVKFGIWAKLDMNNQGMWLRDVVNGIWLRDMVPGKNGSRLGKF